MCSQKQGSQPNWNTFGIPTQVFFDENGNEVHRNIGFMDNKRIVEILSKLGVS